MATDTPNPTAFDDPLTWVNFGVLGLLVLGLLTGFIWAKPSVERLVEERDRCLAERDKAYAERDAMAEVLQEKLIPVVGEFVSTTRSFLPVFQDLQRLQQMIPILQDFIQKAEAMRGQRRP